MNPFAIPGIIIDVIEKSGKVLVALGLVEDPIKKLSDQLEAVNRAIQALSDQVDEVREAVLDQQRSVAATDIATASRLIELVLAEPASPLRLHRLAEAETLSLRAVNLLSDLDSGVYMRRSRGALDLPDQAWRSRFPDSSLPDSYWEILSRRGDLIPDPPGTPYALYGFSRPEGLTWDHHPTLYLLAAAISVRLLVMAVTDPEFRSNDTYSGELESMAKVAKRGLERWIDSISFAFPPVQDDLFVDVESGWRFAQSSFQFTYLPIAACSPSTGMWFYVRADDLPLAQVKQAYQSIDQLKDLHFSYSRDALFALLLQSGYFAFDDFVARIETLALSAPSTHTPGILALKTRPHDWGL